MSAALLKRLDQLGMFASRIDDVLLIRGAHLGERGVVLAYVDHRVAGLPRNETHGPVALGLLLEHGLADEIPEARTAWCFLIAMHVVDLVPGVGEVLLTDFPRLLAAYAEQASKPH